MAALSRAASLRAAPPVWERMQRNAMQTDVSWNRSGSHYARLYRDTVANR
jgi:starch synthase